MDIRCVDLKTNAVKYIPKHLTEKVGFLEKHNLIIQDFSLNLLGEKIEEEPKVNDVVKQKRKRK